MAVDTDVLNITHHDVERWRIVARFVIVYDVGLVVTLLRVHDDTRAVLCGDEAAEFEAVTRHVRAAGLDGRLQSVILYAYADQFIIRDINSRK